MGLNFFLNLTFFRLPIFPKPNKSRPKIKPATKKDMGLYRGDREHPMTLPICSRSGDVIEPLIKPQWFLKTEAMYGKALEAARSGQLSLHPQFYHKEWENWLGGKHVDWCLSRQLWWGHQVPVWSAEDKATGKHLGWICALDESQAREQLTRHKGGAYFWTPDSGPTLSDNVLADIHRLQADVASGGKGLSFFRGLFWCSLLQRDSIAECFSCCRMFDNTDRS